ncbi:MAG TPA: 16S rRNA (adenine(1518)-N(6)/adenine(1519)-N(6))-dimethyltransferase RsmA [Agriterribacter sp.]|nr:16S rRNA (adenine(1518)-N(6)/adenine(1519)-N(6))-dimethyltransferase RsmA [Agriterribacter sp.]HRQ50355.1 16S rRNA (adenine(1518)-N(6)/adenine(1519)-N(6))-dimethyltransferase RsmA [Agriterribacter sp.]
MYTLKKSLGQHFLRDENMVRRIIAVLQEQPFRQLLEIGPGGGALTRHLVQLPGIAFKAIELDEEKILFLENTWPALKGKLIHQSILDAAQPFDGKFMVVGNFPYNISSQILFKILEWKADVEGMVGMFQKEVAQRIASQPGNKIYGILSVLVQAFFEVEYLFEVHEQCFTPPPKVKSAVIRLTPKAEPLRIHNEKQFFLLVKTAFNQRRKTLRNAVRHLFDEEILEKPVFGKRAEQLSVTGFAELGFMMRESGE